MASTLIKRLISGRADLTQAEIASVKTAVSRAAGRGEFKIPILLFVGAIQEIRAGRRPAGMLASRLTAAERADLVKIRNLIGSRSFTLTEIERMLQLGENGFYTAAQLETHFNL